MGTRTYQEKLENVKEFEKGEIFFVNLANDYYNEEIAKIIGNKHDSILNHIEGDVKIFGIDVEIKTSKDHMYPAFNITGLTKSGKVIKTDEFIPEMKHKYVIGIGNFNGDENDIYQFNTHYIIIETQDIINALMSDINFTVNSHLSRNDGVTYFKYLNEFKDKCASFYETDNFLEILTKIK